jgi:hypothetical protein
MRGEDLHPSPSIHATNDHIEIIQQMIAAAPSINTIAPVPGDDGVRNQIAAVKNEKSNAAYGQLVVPLVICAPLLLTRATLGFSSLRT